MQINPLAAIELALAECWAVRLQMEQALQERDEKIKTLQAELEAYRPK